jgi:hypothetical protein
MYVHTAGRSSSEVCPDYYRGEVHDEGLFEVVVARGEDKVGWGGCGVQGRGGPAGTITGVAHPIIGVETVGTQSIILLARIAHLRTIVYIIPYSIPVRIGDGGWYTVCSRVAHES